MKVYVIKNKEGEYYKLDSELLRDYYVKNLIDADLYSEEHIKRFGELKSKDIKWQEITLAEGDLEKELEVYKKALEKLTYYIEYDYDKKKDDIWYRSAKELEMYFINQAKKELKGEKDE